MSEEPQNMNSFFRHRKDHIIAMAISFGVLELIHMLADMSLFYSGALFGEVWDQVKFCLPVTSVNLYIPSKYYVDFLYELDKHEIQFVESTNTLPQTIEATRNGCTVMIYVYNQLGSCRYNVTSCDYLDGNVSPAEGEERIYFDTLHYQVVGGASM